MDACKMLFVGHLRPSDKLALAAGMIKLPQYCGPYLALRCIG